MFIRGSWCLISQLCAAYSLVAPVAPVATCRTWDIWDSCPAAVSSQTVPSTPTEPAQVSREKVERPTKKKWKHETTRTNCCLMLLVVAYCCLKVLKLFWTFYRKKSHMFSSLCIDISRMPFSTSSHPFDVKASMQQSMVLAMSQWLRKCWQANPKTLNNHLDLFLTKNRARVTLKAT